MTERNFILEPHGTPDYVGMMLATVIALKQLQGTGHVHEIEELIKKNEPVGIREKSYKNNDGSLRLHTCLSWVRTYLKMSGDLESLEQTHGRGYWKLTTSGFSIQNRQDATDAYTRYQATQ